MAKKITQALSKEEFSKRWDAGARTMSELDPEFMKEIYDEIKFHKMVTKIGIGIGIIIAMFATADIILST